MRKVLTWLLLGLLLPGPVFALGLGKLELLSRLNEPFEARITLLSPSREELDSLAVKLADPSAFERANVERPFVLSELSFEVRQDDGGNDYVRVFSREPIREPFLNFLVEANWSTGRLFREYTVLLDPPFYGRNEAPPRVSPPAASAKPQPAMSPPAEVSAPEEGTGGAMSPAAGNYSGGDYGPTVATDTLWSIASLTRPDSSISVQQMMLALLRTNPEAFINGNVNGLRRGEILHMPSRDEITSLSPEEAFAQVKAQYRAWEEAGGTVAAVPERPEGATTPAAPAAKPAATTAAPATSKPELKLVASNGGGGGGGDSAGGSTDAKSKENLALAKEQVEALTQENMDLKNRLSESDAIVSDLKRLIQLKDDELAALQKKAASAPAPAATTPPAAATPEAAPQTEAAKGPEGGTTAPAPAETKPAAPKPAPKKEETKPVSATPPPPPAPVQGGAMGILNHVVELVMANLVLVGGALGGLIVVVVAVFWISRRKQQQAEDDGGDVALEFPDFSDSEAETILPGGETDAGDEEEPEPEVEAPKPPPVREAKPAPAAPPAAAPAQKPAAPAPEPEPEPQEDPLAEVNVFLAYEHFDQAEEFVRDAIKKEPDNLEFHAKLLEVFYAANDKKKFEEEAKVLNDLVGGAGPYWDTAVAYWAEMSPNRALFEAPAAGEEEAGAAPAAAGGMLDLTAGEEAKPSADAGLDFDLGEATAGAEPAPAAPAKDEDEVLDITAGSEEGLEATAASGGADESILDVTAATTLEEATAAGASEEDVLDISQGSSEDLLDVTAHADLDNSEMDEDLLDVTTATGSSTDVEGLLEESSPGESKQDDNVVDFDLDLGTGAEEAGDGGKSSEDNVINFEGSGSTGGKEDDGMSLEFESGGDAPAAEEPGLELDLTAGSGDGLSLDSTISEEGGLELDTGDGGLEIEMDGGGEEAGASAQDADSGGDGGIELDLSMEEEAPAKNDIDMEGTVDVSGLKLEMDEDDDDDDEDHTVFVPRTSAAKEQSAEDEIATKLDLAKAYVELGDKDSAKSILDEVMKDGSPQQRKQAQDLMKQMS